jgi:pyruvate formate lyase activating enzyme
MESSSSYEFRTTCVRPIVDEGVVRNISQVIRGAMLYALQRFHNKEVLHPAFFHENETGFDEDGLLHLKSIADPWVQRCVVRS